MEQIINTTEGDVEVLCNTTFSEMSKIDVNKHTEKRNGFTYLSWAWAVKVLGEQYPDFNYKVKKTENGLPYFFEPGVGAMVYTEMTLNGITREMWLPVLDSSNMPMKEEKYSYKVKEYKNKHWTGGYVEKECEPLNMFEVNKAIMRCLVKNIAMFGLGLYIYAGEDLPESDATDKAQVEEAQPVEEDKPITQAHLDRLRELQVNEFNVCKRCGVEALEELTDEQAMSVIAIKEHKIAKQENAQASTDLTAENAQHNGD